MGNVCGGGVAVAVDGNGDARVEATADGLAVKDAAAAAATTAPSLACPFAAAAKNGDHLAACPFAAPPPPQAQTLTSSRSRRPSCSDSDASMPGQRVHFAAGTNPGEAPRGAATARGRSVSLKKIVDRFYDRVLADPIIAPFFAAVDLAKLKSHQLQFMALAFGGRELVLADYPEFDLRRIHKHLLRDRGLTERHWELFYDHFVRTLEDLPEVRGRRGRRWLGDEMRALQAPPPTDRRPPPLNKRVNMNKTNETDPRGHKGGGHRVGARHARLLCAPHARRARGGAARALKRAGAASLSLSLFKAKYLLLYTSRTCPCTPSHSHTSLLALAPSHLTTIAAA
jgi:hemoglobin